MHPSVDALLHPELDHGVETRFATPAGRLQALVRTLHQRSGRRVALLVDEYDKPVTDALHKPAVARANREYLRKLYSVVKACDQHLRFTFLTGVTNFSEGSLFPGLNNLSDITLDPRYSSICGYTDQDLDTVFAAELDGLDRKKIRDWYNGYNWGGSERLYNPYDILLLFDRRRFGPWWFETGTPKFLPDTLVRRGISTFQLDGRLADGSLLSSFDIDEIAVEALLFQTGYLTLASWSENEHGEFSYRLGYPNREVRVSLNRSLLSSLVNGLSQDRLRHCQSVAEHISAGDFVKTRESLRAFFASIPHDWHRNNDIQRYEGYYASVFFALLNGFGLDVRPEETSSHGSLAIAVMASDRIALFEFKTVPGRKGSGKALRQLKEKGYADKHLASGKPVHLVGVEFSTEARNVVQLQWETVGSRGGRAASAVPSPSH